MMSLKYYFSYNSFRRKNIAEIFFNNYDFTDVIDNDRSAIIPRIDNFGIYFRKLFVFMIII